MKVVEQKSTGLGKWEGEDIFTWPHTFEVGLRAILIKS